MRDMMMAKGLDDISVCHGSLLQVDHDVEPGNKWQNLDEC
jgi:hypothetical protein